MSNVNEISKLLTQVAKTKEKLADAKEILKSYKIKSPALSDLMKAKKELMEQINDEKDRIEKEYYEDKDYEQAKNDQLTLKNELKEKASMLRIAVSAKYKVQQLATEDYNIEGEQMKLQLEFAPRIYINGKEFK